MTRAVRDLNRFLEERGCTKQVGLSICDRPEDKAFVVQSSRAAAFVDDKYTTCWQTAEASPGTQVYFLAENRPRARELYHCRSFREFSNHVVKSGFVPVEDQPSWRATFGIP